jgi:large subunit ribosomal protein L28
MLRRSVSMGLSSSARWQQLGVVPGVSSSLSASLMPSVSQLLSSSNLPQDMGACRSRSNRSRRGLYDGKDIRSGNNVSFSMKATKRKFKPNVFTKRVYSEILEEMVRFHLTTSTLRSIDKAGGLDNYLLTCKHVSSGEGLEVKKRVVSKLEYLERQKARDAAGTSGNQEASMAE